MTSSERISHDRRNAHVTIDPLIYEQYQKSEARVSRLESVYNTVTKYTFILRILLCFALIVIACLVIGSSYNRRSGKPAVSVATDATPISLARLMIEQSDDVASSTSSDYAAAEAITTAAQSITPRNDQLHK